MAESKAFIQAHSSPALVFEKVLKNEDFQSQIWIDLTPQAFKKSRKLSSDILERETGLLRAPALVPEGLGRVSSRKFIILLN